MDAIINRSARRPRSISTQLLLAVNVPLAIVLTLLLTIDYRRETADAVAQKHANLDEEAMMIHHSLYFLGSHEDTGDLQRYVDSVCRHMQGSQSSGHHIAVRWRGGLIQAKPSLGSSPDLLKTMQRAAESSDYLAPRGDETLVVGKFSGSGVDVYVSEYTTNIHRAIRENILFHLASLVVLALAAAAIVNPMLWNTVTRPLRKISHAVVGIAAGDYDAELGRFSSRELRELSDAVRTMSDSLASHERHRRSQMTRAKSIQEHLLPGPVEIPGLTVARVFAPAEDVAGDYYDLIRLPDDTWLICVADVSGHGVPAALGSVILKTILSDAAAEICDPGGILRHVNQRLAVLLPNQFATMFLGRWHPESLRLGFASAGHEPGLLVPPQGESRLLSPTGPLLGLDETTSWETEYVDLCPGDRVLLTTDGVAEARAPDGRLFGRESLTNVAVSTMELSPDDAANSIRSAVLEHQAGESPTDDLTILLLEIKPVLQARSMQRGGEPVG